MNLLFSIPLNSNSNTMFNSLSHVESISYNYGIPVTMYKFIYSRAVSHQKQDIIYSRTLTDFYVNFQEHCLAQTVSNNVIVKGLASCLRKPQSLQHRCQLRELSYSGTQWTFNTEPTDKTIAVPFTTLKKQNSHQVKVSGEQIHHVQGF